MVANHHDFLLLPRGDGVFVAARLHSRRVKFFKAVLPLVVVLIAAVFSWFTFFATTPMADILSLNSEQATDQLVMTHPKVEGYSKMGKPYSLTAKRAIHEPQRGDGMIRLQEIEAQMPLGERGQAFVAARASIFDNVNGRMRFDQPFDIKTSDGVWAKLRSADVNIATSQLVSREAVEIHQGRSSLQAGTMQVLEGGQLFVFADGVKLLIAPAPPEP